MVAVKVGSATACMQMSRPLVQYTPPLSPLSPRRREAGAPAASATPFSPLSPRRVKSAASAIAEFDRALAGRLFLSAGAAGLPRSTTPLGNARLVRRAFSAESFFPHGGSEGDHDGELSEKLGHLPPRFEERGGGGGGGVDRPGDGAVTEARSAATHPSSPSSASSPPTGTGLLRKSGSCVDVAPPQWLGIARDPPSWPPELAQIGGPADDTGTWKQRREGSEKPPKQAQQQQLQLQNHDADGEKLRTALTLWGLEEGLKEASETACCSVRRAFSSVVFIIRELHSHTLQLRELLFYEDLRGILTQAQKETHASFCWLFQQIFSCTPTLMVSLMLLLANYTAHSMALAAAPPLLLPPTATVTVSIEYDTGSQQGEKEGSRIDISSAMRTYSAIKGNHSGRTASVNGGGGGNGLRPIAGATDDWRSPSRQPAKFLPDGGGGGVMDTPAPTQEDQLHEEGGGPPASVGMDEEARAWRRVEEEAARMQAAARHEALTDRETLLRLVAPVAVALESDRHYTEFIRTELAYQEAIQEEPSNTLLLANYAQFLFLVACDYRRAEHYFKRAVSVKPADPESLNRYANFLWLAKKDLCGAEETYLEAIEAEPENSCYAANYAHFLFSTGCDDLCFPLNDGFGAGADEVDEG